MELPKPTTTEYFTTRADAVRYVKDQLLSLRNDSQWTMTIEPDESAGYFVFIATGTS